MKMDLLISWYQRLDVSLLKLLLLIIFQLQINWSFLEFKEHAFGFPLTKSTTGSEIIFLQNSLNYGISYSFTPSVLYFMACAEVFKKKIHYHSSTFVLDPGQQHK